MRQWVFSGSLSKQPYPIEVEWPPGAFEMVQQANPETGNVVV